MRTVAFLVVGLIAVVGILLFLTLERTDDGFAPPDSGDQPISSQRPPIIDMHLHAIEVDSFGPPPQTICASVNTFLAWDPLDSYPTVFSQYGADPGCGNVLVSPMTNEEVMRETLEVLERRNIIGVTSGPLEFVERWAEAAPDRIIRGLQFRLYEGAPNPETIRRWHDEGKVAVLAEVTNQYLGVEPDDPRFEPYLAMAEEIDMPVGIHIGTGPPGAPYLGSVDYRARMHSPLSLEEPLLKHQKLRVYVMHAGWPMLDDTLALMWTHPQVYVEVGAIDYALPRAEFHRYLRRLVDSGFGNRVMFGSDQMIWPGAIEHAIESIESADFLTEEQKRDIFYNNAARFLRLSDEEVAGHHGR